MQANSARYFLLALASLGFLFSGGRSVQGETIYNVSTGLDASNNVLASGGLSDAHWTVSEQAGGFGAAQSVFPNNADWFSGWLGNNSSSDWIARNANITNNGPAPYTFTTTFDLTNSMLSTVSLAGSWAVDDAGTLALNGYTLGTLGSGAWGSLTSFSVLAGSADFVQGINTLSITITSDDQYLEGVRLQGIVSGSLVPEPSTIISTMIGCIVVFGCRRLGQKKRSL